MMYYSAIKWGKKSIDSYNNLDDFPRIYVEWEKGNPKDTILYDSTYIKF